MKKSGYFLSKDAKLYYRKVGKGPPMVMLHGNRQSHRVFKELARIFSKDYLVVLPDSRGHGRSQFGRRKLSIPLLAEDTRNLMGELGIEQAVFLGFSDGANTALEFAANFPNQAKAVIAVSPNINPEGLKRGLAMLLKISLAIFHFLERFHLALWKEKQLTLLMTNVKIPTEKIEKITAPVLILTGKRDMIREEHSRLIASLIPKGEVEVLGNNHHFSLFRKTKLYVELMTDFLNKNS